MTRFAPGRRFLLPFVALAPLVQPPADVLAGEGTPRPPCGQTLWVAGVVPETVVHPGVGQPISVPISIGPYVDWNPNLGACAAPVAAVLSVQLELRPADGGPPTFVAPSLVPVGVPTAPGLQPLLTGPGGTPELGGTVEAVVGADVLAPGTVWRCAVSMTYSVTFSGGAGNGEVTALRRTYASIGPPSPAGASRPRLELRHLDTGEGGLVARRRGDPAAHAFAVLNNDPNVGVDLSFFAFTVQLARLPSGANGDDTIFSLAAPELDRDSFALAFADFLDQGTLVPEVDPTKKSTTLIERTLHLGPGDVRVVTLLVRGHGAAADGACVGVTAGAFGAFEDETPAAAEVSVLQRVADVPAAAPLFELTDSVTAAATVDATWSPATFDGVAARRTHGPGNLVDGGGTRTVGAALADHVEFADSAADTLRTEEAVDRCEYTVVARDHGRGGEEQRNEVVLKNLATATMPLDVRVFARNGGEGDLKLLLDAESGLARLLDLSIAKKKKQQVFEGNWSNLVATPPNGYLTLEATVRSFTVADGTVAPVVATIPEAFAGTFAPAATPDDVGAFVNDPRSFGAALDWGATSDGPAVTPSAASGVASSQPTFALATGSMAPFPDVTVTNVTITSPDATRGPVVLPFVTRTRADATAPQPLTVTSFSGVVKFAKDGKDKLVLKGTIPIEEGFSPKGETVHFELDSLHVGFTLDGKGKAKSGKHRLAIALKKKAGTIQAGDRPFTLRLRKAELSALLSRHFVRADGPEETLIASTMPVRSWWFHGAQMRAADVTLSSFVTPKKGTFSGVVVE